MEPLRATKHICYVTYKALEAHFAGVQVDSKVLEMVPDVQCPLFVTWHTVVGGNSELRGCIGTLHPIKLRKGLCEYAVHAAVDDSRFLPMDKKEFHTGNLSVDVNLLVQFEDCAPLDWEVGKHGIEIKYEGHHAVFLPSVAKEQGWEQKETLYHLLHKGGVRVKEVDDNVLGKISCVRFQSSAAEMPFAEYKTYANFK